MHHDVIHFLYKIWEKQVSKQAGSSRGNIYVRPFAFIIFINSKEIIFFCRTTLYTKYLFSFIKNCKKIKKNRILKEEIIINCKKIEKKKNLNKF